MTSTTIEALEKVFDVFILIEPNTINSKEVKKAKVSMATELLKAIEAEKLKGQIGILQQIPQTYDHLESGDEYVPSLSAKVLQDKIQSLQQQLDSIEKPESK